MKSRVGRNLLGVLLVAGVVVLVASEQEIAPGAQVVFKLDDRTIKGPKSLVVEAGSNKAVLRIARKNPPVAPWSSKNIRTVVFPSWAYDARWVSICVRVKGRDLHFDKVGIPRDIGGLVIRIDRSPFNDDVSHVVGEDSDATELYIIEVQQIERDGEFYFYTR